MRSLVSWSGGKDSCLAAHLAVEAGADLEALVCMKEPDADRSRSHALPAWVLRAQAEAMGVSISLPEAGWADYETVFCEALRRARAAGITQAVFGDIDLQPHRDWEEKVCAATDVTPVLPLWGWPRSRVVEEIFRRRIHAVVVCVNTRYLDAGYCGRTYDRDFVASLPAGVDACGEGGEFHTCVVDAPLFRTPVALCVSGERRYRAPAELGGDEYCFAELAP